MAWESPLCNRFSCHLSQRFLRNSIDSFLGRRGTDSVQSRTKRAVFEPRGAQLGKDLVHNARGEDYFAVGDWRRSLVVDGAVKRFDEEFHSRFRVKIIAEKRLNVSQRIAGVLFGQVERADELLKEAFATGASQFDERFVVLVQN